MIRHLLRFWLSFIIPTFYKRIQAHGLHHLYSNEPMIIAMNHPNAFTDPILFSYLADPVRLHYMARGDAFKPGIASWLLEKIGIVPIFRMQDAGKEGLKKNDATYRRVNAMLKNNAKVIVFAEGLCIQERRLRPLKKGVARMVFGAHEFLQHNRLKVLPVGVNYSKPDKFRSKALYMVGEPMRVADYYEAYKQHPAKTMNQFLQDLDRNMKKLVIHICSSENDDIVHWIEKLQKSELKSHAANNNLHREFIQSQQIVELVEKADPEKLKSFHALAASYFKQLNACRLKDWLFYPDQHKKNNWSMFCLRVLLLLICSPVYLAGLIFNLPPLAATGFLTGKIVKEIEFFSSFAIGIGMFVFPLFYTVWFYLFYSLSCNLPAALGLCLLAGLAGWATLFLHPFALRTAGLWRYLQLGKNVKQLHKQRSVLLKFINNF